MWNDVIRWWQALWSDPKVVAIIVGGFISALLIFLVKDAIWQLRIARLQALRQRREKDLELFYAPLYRIFREGYARFDHWKNENPGTLVVRQAFFQSDDSELAIAALVNAHSECATPQVIRLWAETQAITEPSALAARRRELTAAVIREYHDLRRALHLAYDQTERKTGQFAVSPSRGIET
jgi:hypothetical protein